MRIFYLVTFSDVEVGLVTCKKLKSGEPVSKGGGCLSPKVGLPSPSPVSTPSTTTKGGRGMGGGSFVLVTGVGVGLR
jgi:hypothetical protein